MFNRLHRHLLATGLAAGLAFTSVSAVPVAAADDPGSTPGAAMAPAQEWSVLEAAQRRWYVFHYEATNDDDDSLNQALVEVETNVEDSVSFEVWTTQGLQFRPDADEYEPVGRGSKMVDDEFTLVWAGSSTASDTYYILVENERNEPSYYELTISGDGVSIPERATAEMSVADDTTVVNDAIVVNEAVVVNDAPVVEAPATAAAMGTSADNAASPADGWMMLGPGQRYWYEFKFDFDEGDDLTPQTSAMIELEMQEAGTVHFEVWTPEQLNKWQNDEDFDPMGAGSVLLEGTDAEDEAELIWTGSDQASGTYYVIVENDSSGTATYAIEITGTGVSF